MPEVLALTSEVLAGPCTLLSVVAPDDDHLEGTYELMEGVLYAGSPVYKRTQCVCETRDANGAIRCAHA